MGDARVSRLLVARGQAVVEMALLLPVLLLLMGSGVDLARGYSDRALARSAVSFGAQAAALGQPDAIVREVVTADSAGVLRAERVSVTPCWQRETAGRPVTVRGEWYFRPIFPLSEMWWSRAQGDRPIVHEIILPAVLPCKQEGVP